jgi:hypothetical protein
MGRGDAIGFFAKPFPLFFDEECSHSVARGVVVDASSMSPCRATPQQRIPIIILPSGSLLDILLTFFHYFC